MQTSACVLNEAVLLSSPCAPVIACEWWEPRSRGGEGTPKPQLRYCSHTSSTHLFSYHCFHSFSLLGTGTPAGQAPPKTPSQTPETPHSSAPGVPAWRSSFLPLVLHWHTALHVVPQGWPAHSNSICLWTLAKPKELQRHHSSWKDQWQTAYLCYLSP